VLDLVGDLALLGLPVQGHFKAVRSGHALHQSLVAELRANPSCWSVEVAGSEEEVDETSAEALRLSRVTAS
jgi:UDP-3-O-[3-hydroxymyristoyl] N-acetylglucosamine deacetylase